MKFSHNENTETALKQLYGENGRMAEKYRFIQAAFEQIDAGIALTDTEGTIIAANRAFAAMHGYEQEELADRHISALLTEDEISRIDNVKSRINSNRVFDGEARHKRKDGSVFPVHVHISLISDDSGEDVAIVGIVSDITRQKNIERELALSEKKYRSVFQNTGTATLIVEEDHTISLVNDEFIKLSGYSREEVEGRKKWTEFIVGEQLARMKEYHRMRREDGEQPPRSYESDMRDRWGNVKRILLKVDIIPGTSRGIASLHDITEQKNTIRALEESKKKFRTLFENTPGGIIIIGRDYRIRDVNSRTCEITGYTREELVGEFCDIVCPKGMKSRECPIWQGGSDGFTGMETEIKCRDGSRKPILKNAKKIELENETYILENYQDISERKRLEEERQKHSKLESVGTLAGGIAHDFNNLLGAISGYIEIAGMQTGENAVSEYLDNSMKAIGRAKALTQQLLTFSRGGAPVKEPVDIKEIIRETVEFSLRGSSSSAEYIFDGEFPNILLDSGQISQVFQNLAINAIQAMPEGGTLTLSLINKDITSHPRLRPGRYLRIEVRDQGTGIPEKHLPNIFDPYFTTKQKGSGLGLATVFSIIKNHGGDIIAASTLGEGTVFTIHLPVTQSDLDVPSERDKSLIRGNGERILVLEDDELLGRSFANMISAIKYKPEIVTSSREAIDKYRKAYRDGEPYDAVITDLTIKGDTGGEEINRQILEMNPDAKTIVSSGYATDPIMSNYREYGYSAALPKPVMIDTLSRVLNQVLNSN